MGIFMGGNRSTEESMREHRWEASYQAVSSTRGYEPRVLKEVHLGAPGAHL